MAVCPVWSGNPKEGFEGLGYKPILNQDTTIINPVINAGCLFHIFLVMFFVRLSAGYIVRYLQ